MCVSCEQQVWGSWMVQRRLSAVCAVLQASQHVICMLEASFLECQCREAPSARWCSILALQNLCLMPEHESRCNCL
jgi:hypothetical protein